MTDEAKTTAALVFAALLGVGAEVALKGEDSQALAVGDTLSDAQAQVMSGTAEAGTVQATCLAVVAKSALALKGVDATSGLTSTGQVCVRGLWPDGSPVSEDVPGAYVFGCKLTGRPCDSKTDPVASMWLQGNAKAAWTCACAAGPSCSWTVLGLTGKSTTSPAPLGITLGEGTWSGSDCVPKPCLALADTSGDITWPKQCPPE